MPASLEYHDVIAWASAAARTTVLGYTAHDQMGYIVIDEKGAVLVVLAAWVGFAGLLGHRDATIRRLSPPKPLFWCVLNPIDRFPAWRGKRSYNVVLVEESPPFVPLEASRITAPSVSIAITTVSRCNDEVRVVVLRKVPERDQRTSRTLAGIIPILELAISSHGTVATSLRPAASVRVSPEVSVTKNHAVNA